MEAHEPVGKNAHCWHYEPDEDDTGSLASDTASELATQSDEDSEPELNSSALLARQFRLFLQGHECAVLRLALSGEVLLESTTWERLSLEDFEECRALGEMLDGDPCTLDLNSFNLFSTEGRWTRGAMSEEEEAGVRRVRRNWMSGPEKPTFEQPNANGAIEVKLVGADEHGEAVIKLKFFGRTGYATISRDGGSLAAGSMSAQLALNVNSATSGDTFMLTAIGLTGQALFGPAPLPRGYLAREVLNEIARKGRNGKLRLVYGSWALRDDDELGIDTDEVMLTCLQMGQIVSSTRDKAAAQQLLQSSPLSVKSGAHMVLVKYSAGKTIASLGSPCDSIFFLVQGIIEEQDESAAVVKHLYGRSPQRLASGKSAVAFGCLEEGAMFPATYVTATDVAMYMLTKRAYEEAQFERNSIIR